MSQRRQVRVAPSFFDGLDELLPEERSATGGPSTADFLLHEFPYLGVPYSGYDVPAAAAS